ncbi:MAG TPA: RNA polymerase sigma factor [Gaiellaceae bacterium]|nr:RNA polymerase sigma factor [Gaiellaceae bacterium]
MGNDDDASVSALEQLYRTRYRRFLRVALAVTGSRDAAADAVQEAFARALRHRHDFRGEGSVESWVWRTVLNVSLTQRRTGRRETAVDVLEEPAAPTNGYASESAEVRTAVAALPERQRHALFLRHYADLSYDEIADVLGVARGTVAATLHAAHDAVRRAMEGVPR